MCEPYPKVVCLCGSTRFYEAFQLANYKFTMGGSIVLTVGFYPHAAHIGVTPEQKEKLDDLHFRKIDMADNVHFLNIDGYIGASTARELAYSVFAGKTITYEDPALGEEFEKRNALLLGAMAAAFMRGQKPLLPTSLAQL